MCQTAPLGLALGRVKCQRLKNRFTQQVPVRHKGFKWGLSRQTKGNAAYFRVGFVPKLLKRLEKAKTWPLHRVLSAVNHAKTFFLAQSEVCEPVSSEICTCKANARPQ